MVKFDLIYDNLRLNNAILIFRIVRSQTGTTLILVYSESMSHLPEIMESIAKTILNKKSTQKDPQDEDSNEHPVIANNEDPKITAVNIDQPATQKQLATNKIIQFSQSSVEVDDYFLEKAKDFFIVSQKRKLKSLYPNFLQKEVQSAACRIWQDLPKEQKYLYLRKQKQQEDELFEKLQNWKKLSVQSLGHKKSNNHDLKEYEAESAQETQTKNQHMTTNNVPMTNENLSDNAQNSQSLSSLQQGQIRTQHSFSNRANDDTNTSSMIGDQINNVQIIIIPQIEALAQVQKSDIQDADIQSKEEVSQTENVTQVKCHIESKISKTSTDNKNVDQGDKKDQNNDPDDKHQNSSESLIIKNGLEGIQQNGQSINQ